MRLMVVVLVVAVGAGSVWFVARAATPEASPTTTDVPAMDVEPASVAPGSAAPTNEAGAPDVPNDGASTGAGAPRQQPEQEGPDSLDEWAAATAAATGIPARALSAYGHAELALREHQPGCQVSWATLAGIGRVESDHGRYGGATLGEDGRPSIPIIGVPLNGAPGVRTITDTDGGRLDGDPHHDRAVGPMQFIPSTWMRYASDGNGDGNADPQQIDDAALTAARYLCVGGRDMASPDGWWAGIMSYNNSVEYAQKVFGLADTYAAQAAGTRD
ncbi:murein transglycosylase [Saccharomonospora sp. CUA-673]|uniref:lytic transglycosylase domain-containing protein n=1 Tax=Saccharomonospora sp. CUA-673 TaxID=1904969 RepID=UPI00096611C8|nr:lytic murein transglycosylase [Saccharomonospora sp. CUA-673]OLT42755.1 murein transglycosylase [Saccharomonospora sp. CUA-673]